MPTRPPSNANRSTPVLSTPFGFSNLIFAAEDDSVLREITEQELLLSRRKRPHQKSRNGCLCCKHRRVKCDETFPSCSNCVKRGDKCKWPSHPQQRVRVRSKSPPGVASIGRNLPGCAFPSVNLLHMKLFHHFGSTTCKTLVFKEVWEGGLRLSFENEHLMHSILFVAARHLSLLSPNETAYSTAALSHLSQASRLYREALSKPFTESNVDAILCTAVLLYYDAWTNMDFMPADADADSPAPFPDLSKDHLFTFSGGMLQIFMKAVPLLTYNQSPFIKGIIHSPSRSIQEVLSTSHVNLTKYQTFLAEWYDRPVERRALELPKLSLSEISDDGAWVSPPQDYQNTDDPQQAHMWVICRLSVLLVLLEHVCGDSGFSLIDHPDLLENLSRLIFTFPIFCHAPYIRRLGEINSGSLLLMYHFYRAARMLLAPYKQCWWATNRATVLEKVLEKALLG